jgi:Putative prokaryotic signal transducing protein
MNVGEEELVGVAHATDRAEAEMIQGLLESAGIPSVLQQVGIDGPLLGVGWLNPGGGSRRVMVRASQSEEAQSLLANSLAEGERVDLPETAAPSYPEETEGRKPRSYGLIGAYVRIWAWSFGAMLLAFAVFLLLREV